MTKEEKEKKKAEEAANIFDRVNDANLSTLTERVAWILNHFPEARDSDITCQLRFWEVFDKENYSKDNFDVVDLYKLTRLTSIARARAKIQNEYGLFLASEKVRRHRGTLSEEEKEKAIEEKPSYPVFMIYGDESGKTDKYLIAGSMWIADNVATLSLFNAINAVKEKNNRRGEIHSKDIDQQNAHFYQEIIDIVYEYSSTIGFKSIFVERAGLKDINRALTYLFFTLLFEGVKKENELGRARLPRSIQFIKDSDAVGSDKVMLSEIKDKLLNASKIHLDNLLTIDKMIALDSKSNIFIQIVDLFTSSINRKINTDLGGKLPKDTVSNYFMEKFKVNRKEEVIEEVGDCISIDSL